MDSTEATVMGGSQHPSMEQLRMYLIGELDLTVSQEVGFHVETCEQCSRLSWEISNRDSRASSQTKLATPIPGDTNWNDTSSVETGPRRVQAGYEILDELGRGGMAVVYKARQLGLNRLVALKRIRSGSGAGGMERARFRREAESAARLIHPNIVQIYDVGEQDEEPYMAMEYLPGGTLASRLSLAPLKPTDAAQLMVLLARGVHFAHQAGVVHRDLKPANILFSISSEEQGITEASLCNPKIGDFGLAKQLDQTESTMTMMFAGTPSYMAPEQTIDASQVGPLADVYSLGVILYECLTGRRPFHGTTMLETIDLVRNAEPPLPSQIQNNCPRDLDTICRKCLEKDPARRYASAQALAEDLQRFLEGIPIQARPANALERAWKWSKRNPAVAGASAVVGITFLVLLISGWVMNGILSDSLTRRTASEQRALKFLNKAREAWNANLWMVSSKILRDLPNTQLQREELLNQALDQYEELYSIDDQLDSHTRGEHIWLLETMADLQSDLGNDQKSVDYYVQAIEKSEILLRELPEDIHPQYQAAHLRIHFGKHYLLNQDWKMAEAHLLESRSRFQNLHQSDKENPDILTHYAWSMDLLAQVLKGQGEIEPAQKMRKQVIEHLNQLTLDSPPPVKPDSNNTEAKQGRFSTPELMRLIAMMYHNSGLAEPSPERSQEYLLKSIQTFRELVKIDPKSRGDRASLANALLNRGSLTRQRKEIEEARQLYLTLSQQFPFESEWIEGQARCDYLEAQQHMENRDLATARQLMQRAVRYRERIEVTVPDNIPNQIVLADSRSQLALVLVQQSLFEEAEPLYLQSLTKLNQLLPNDPRSPGLIQSIVSTSLNLAELLRMTHRVDDSLNHSGRAIELVEGALKIEPRSTTLQNLGASAHGSRALSLQQVGRYSESIPDWDRLIELTPPESGVKHRMNRVIVLALAGVYARAAEEAEFLAELPDRTGDDLYNLSCVYAMSIKHLDADQKLEGEKKPPLRESYATRGTQLLLKLKNQGYFSSESAFDKLKTDTDLDPLRGRSDFQSLLRDDG